MNGAPHITVCVCTYKRPQYLRRLLTKVCLQKTNGRFTFSIVVADNDASRSAEVLVTGFTAGASVPIHYCVEPEQNIARARNRAVSAAQGEFIAFIDDDEFPADDWLATLFSTQLQTNADGVLGPVVRHFDEQPPQWVVRCKLYDRPRHPTGFVLGWKEARTGNVLLRRELFAQGVAAFRPEFRAGEDQDFFRRKMDEGCVFVWCDEAVAYESVPPQRWKRRILLKRALLRGATARLQPDCDLRNIGKSMVAIGVYTCALPFAFILGHDRFVTLLVKLCDHLGKVTAFIGINPIKEPYVTE